MSIGVLSAANLPERDVSEQTQTACVGRTAEGRWNPGAFATQQINALVRRVFFSEGHRPIRQIVVSAVDGETEIGSLCKRVAETLAKESAGSVALVGCAGEILDGSGPDIEQRGRKDLKPLQKIANRITENLWSIPAGLGETTPAATISGLHAYLAEVRREFEFSIIQARPLGQSCETAALAQFSDGIILVLSTKHTRRIAAQRVKDTLTQSQARILGTVLADREFPVPEGIYRRL